MNGIDVKNSPREYHYLKVQLSTYERLVTFTNVSKHQKNSPTLSASSIAALAKEPSLKVQISVSLSVARHRTGCTLPYPDRKCKKVRLDT